MKEAVPTAPDTVVRDATVVTLSIKDAVPAEIAKRVGEHMGLYDRPEHPFRMYAAALG